MPDALVSIIIPVYNAGATLSRTLQSVVDQTYEAKEIIVVDGCSTDNTPDIIRTFRDRLDCVLTAKDGGVYEAINRGLVKASGEWIYILGADDFFSDNNVLRNCLQGLTEDIKLVLGDVLNFGSANSFIPSRHRNAFGRLMYWKNTMHQQGVFYHQSIFADFRFDETCRVLADYDLHMYLFRRNIPYRKVDVVIANCSASGLSKQFTPALYREELRIKRKRLNWFIYAMNIPWVWLKFALKKLG